MVSEIHQLSEKVSQLAELTFSLRRENAELRISMAALAAENTDLSDRIEEAYRRVNMLLEKMPVPISEKGSEEDLNEEST